MFDHAHDHLGDVVYVELPEVGAAVTHGVVFGAVESAKATTTTDINSPVSEKVVEVEMSETQQIDGFTTVFHVM
ncbi:putative glycine cleavage system H-protein/Simiate [Medicago truncatula]|uniref:Putative glycine cleavage system H-protein/Simiate n=1 Tax=Medicago truncatula TaxID=3880 RepID=A0A396H498_MEDTR|nr:putative glycine cleavage system H-protein/Simiate [Medicago truncatula]